MNDVGWVYLESPSVDEVYNFLVSQDIHSFTEMHHDALSKYASFSGFYNVKDFNSSGINLMRLNNNSSGFLGSSDYSYGKIILPSNFQKVNAFNLVYQVKIGIGLPFEINGKSRLEGYLIRKSAKKVDDFLIHDFNFLDN